MIRGQDTEEVLYVWWGCVEQGDGDGCWHRPEPPSHSVINTTAAALSTLHQLQPLPTNNLQTSHITHNSSLISPHTADGLQSTLLTMLFKKFHVSLTRFYVTHYRYRDHGLIFVKSQNAIIITWLLFYDFLQKPISLLKLLLGCEWSLGDLESSIQLGSHTGPAAADQRRP